MKSFFAVSLLLAVPQQWFASAVEIPSPGFGSGNIPEMEPQNELNDWGHVPFQSRIVGGIIADASRYPWHVDIGGCGGSL